MKTFMQGVEKLMTALNVPGIPLVIPIGTNSEFESERNKWLENSTQGEHSLHANCRHKYLDMTNEASSRA